VNNSLLQKGAKRRQKMTAHWGGPRKREFVSANRKKYRWGGGWLKKCRLGKKTLGGMRTGVQNKEKGRGD